MAKANHHNALLEAGLATFHRRGYHATGVQDIVEHAGVPKGSFYNHFVSKETLCKAVIDHYWARADVAREILKDQSLSVPVRIDDHLKALGCPEEGCLLGNFTAELASEESFRAYLAEFWNSWLKALASCLSEGQRDGSVRTDISAAELAQLILTQWEGTLLIFRIERDPALLTKARRLIQKIIKS